VFQQPLYKPDLSITLDIIDDGNLLEVTDDVMDDCTGTVIN